MERKVFLRVLRVLGNISLCMGSYICSYRSPCPMFLIVVSFKNSVYFSSRLLHLKLLNDNPADSGCSTLVGQHDPWIISVVSVTRKTIQRRSGY